MPNFSEWLTDIDNSYFQDIESAFVSSLKRLFNEYISDDVDVNIFDDDNKQKPKRGFFDE